MKLEGIILKAEEAMNNNDFQGAIKFYNKALEIEKLNAKLYSERGVCYFNLQKNELALMDLDKAVALEPNNPYRYSSRAFVNGAIKNTKSAIEDYEKAIELDPEDAISRNNLGLVQEQLGYTEKAKKNFEVADELAGILKDNKIITERKKESIEAAAEENKTMETKNSIKSEMIGVLTSKSKFKEFLSFVKNGFKLTKDSE